MEINGPIIDADSHVEEPDEVWDYLEDRYRSRRPQIVSLQGLPGVTDVDAFWLIDGAIYPKPVGHGASIFGTPVTSTYARNKPFDVGSQSLTDVDARIRDLDRAGIDIQIMFSTIFNETVTEDAHFEAALIRAYNTWMSERCARYPDRLKFAAVIPTKLPDQAVAEVRRAKELGAACVALSATKGDVMLHDPMFDPIWAECQRLRIPVASHVVFHHPALRHTCDTVYAANIIGGNIPVFLNFYSFVGGGILDRFPDLRVGFFEAGADWLPYLMQRMEHYYDAGTHFPWYGRPQRRPREYPQRGNVYVGTEGEEELLPKVMEWIGEDHVLVSADMPHAEARENSMTAIKERGDISDTAKRKILSENPARFYGL